MNSRLYAITICQEINQDGEEVIGFQEDGDATLVTKLGLLEMAKQTVTVWAEEEDEDDGFYI